MFTVVRIMNDSKGVKKAIAGRIRSLTKEKDPSQAEVARRAEMNRSDLNTLLSGLETGTANPTLDTLLAIERAIGKPILKVIRR